MFLNVLLCNTFLSFLFDLEKKTGCFTLIVYLVFCDCYCSVALSYGVVGWSAVCDCGISLSYSLAFLW